MLSTPTPLFMFLLRGGKGRGAQGNGETLPQAAASGPGGLATEGLCSRAAPELG